MINEQGIIDCPSHLMKLDLGSGRIPAPGFQSVDKAAIKVDWHVDLFEYPWPWEDESVFALRANHFLEHVPDLIPFMNEAYRVLSDHGTFEIIVPYLTSRRAFQDPTHQKFFSENAFLYYDQDWRFTNKLDYYPIQSNFKMLQVIYIFDPQYECLSDDAKNYARLHYWDVVLDMHLILKKEK